MGYSNSVEFDAPLAMPVSDYSGRSSRSSVRGPDSRSPLQSNRKSTRRGNLKQGLKALLSPITPGRRKRSVVNSESRSRKSLSPKLFGLSPKTPGGRKKFVMNKLAINHLDHDDDEPSSRSPKSRAPATTGAPRRKLSKNSIINKLGITNLDDDDESDSGRASALKSPKSPKLSPTTPGKRRINKKSLILSDIFMKGLDDDFDTDENDKKEDTGPSALDIWRAERKVAMSQDHVTCRDYQGNSNSMKCSKQSTGGNLRGLFSRSDNSVRYSVRKEKKDDSLDLAMLVMDEMEDSSEFMKSEDL
ncbi:unnamed protein product [Cylindrotheca closterium]|uniref:Uncharacterized protein n=1 Tax=Cylindrotheca closterium TaxID=2856 RepID=A0AAD2GCS7_9STRA|nr:unnamed protein product [Cylindrotheca closterium]